MLSTRVKLDPRLTVDRSEHPTDCAQRMRFCLHHKEHADKAASKIENGVQEEGATDSRAAKQRREAQADEEVEQPVRHRSISAAAQQTHRPELMLARQ